MMLLGAIAAHQVDAGGMARFVADMAAAVDTVGHVFTPTSGFYRTTASNAGASDTAARTASCDRAIADTAAAVDTVEHLYSPAGVFFRTATDTAAATDAAAAVLTPAYDAVVLADSPLVYWRMDEAGGTSVTDYSGNGRTGTQSATIAGGTAIIAGTARASAFTNDTLQIADAAWQDQTSWTAEIWFRTTGTGASYGLACRDDASGFRHWDLHMNEPGGGGGTGHVDWSGWVSNTRHQIASTQATLNDGQRHHAVGTYDGSTLRLYVDGAESGTPISIAGLNTNTTAPLRIGGHTGITGPNADLAGFAYYPSALSAARVLAHYDAGMGGRFRFAADTATVTDAAAKVSSRSLGVADTAAATDAVEHVYTPAGTPQVRSASDTAAATDAVTHTQTPAIEAEILADSPLVYWRMDEASGTSVTDRSGNSRTGTLSVAAVAGTAILSGTPRSLNFTNDTLTIADATWMDQIFWTVEIWFRSSDTGAARGLACRDNGSGTRHWDIHLNETVTGRVDVRGWSTNTARQVNSTSTSLNDGNPHHVVATYDGDALRLYIDGAETGTALNIAGLNSNVTSQIRLGGHTGGTGVSGDLAGFAYYSTALSSTRIAAHYDAGTP